jgi:hypothetical protein
MKLLLNIIEKYGENLLSVYSNCGQSFTVPADLIAAI